jgi:hypothetical protein
MIEYIILDDVHSEIQNKLNQWRHDYMLQIYVIKQSETSPNKTYVALGRMKNQEPIPQEYRV